MSQAQTLDDRMKDYYEHRFRFALPRRNPVIIRVDGKAFHTATKGFEKPADLRITQSMQAAAIALCEEIQGAKLAYWQSDEISVLVTDYDDVATQAWYDYNLQKITSVSASIATLGFNRKILQVSKESFEKTDFLFDSRAFMLPKEEVINYFVWRQQDATRNSINALARIYFSHTALHGKSTDQVQEMLLTAHSVNWNEIPTWQKRGACIVRNPNRGLVNGVKQPNWIVDAEMPILTQDRAYIEKLVYVGEDK